MSLIDGTVWSGCRHPYYARSFVDEGRLQQLEHSQGWIIEHDISKTSNSEVFLISLRTPS